MGAALIYVLTGVFLALCTLDPYRAATSATNLQSIAFIACCAVAWPYFVWRIIKR